MTRDDRSVLLLVVALCAACPSGSGGETEGPTSGSSAETTTTTGPTTDAPTTSTSSGSTTGEPTTSDATTEPPPACPDGDLDDGELCDDGNTINGDGCNNDCTPSGALLFEHRPAVKGSDQVRSIAVAGDGTIVVGGLAGGNVGWVARFDGQLQPIWSHSYVIDGLVIGVAAGESSFFAAGSLFTDVDGHDAWVARLSLDGAVAWEHTVSSGLGDEYFTQAAAVDGGGVVVAGFGRGDDALTTLAVRRYTVDGVEKWAAAHPLQFDAKIWPLGPGLAVRSDAVVAGYGLATGEGSPEFLAAFSPGDGGPLWTFALPESNGAVNAIAVNDAGLVLAGPQNFMALGVRQVESTGQAVWSSQECTGTNARDVAVDSQGDIVVIGDGPGATAQSIRLCKFAPDGTMRWGKDIDGGFGVDRGAAVAIDAEDRIVAGGAMFDETLVSDVWLASFSP